MVHRGEQLLVAQVESGISAATRERSVKSDYIGIAGNCVYVDKVLRAFSLGARRVAEEYFEATFAGKTFHDAAHMSHAHYS